MEEVEGEEAREVGGEEGVAVELELEEARLMDQAPVRRLLRPRDQQVRSERSGCKGIVMILGDQSGDTRIGIDSVLYRSSLAALETIISICG